MILKLHLNLMVTSMDNEKTDSLTREIKELITLKFLVILNTFAVRFNSIGLTITYLALFIKLSFLKKESLECYLDSIRHDWEEELSILNRELEDVCKEKQLDFVPIDRHDVYFKPFIRVDNWVSKLIKIK